MWVFLIAVANVIGSITIQGATKWYNLRKLSAQKSVKLESLYAENYQGLLQAIKDLEDENIEYSRLLISTEKKYNEQLKDYSEIVNTLIKVLDENDIEVPSSLYDKLNYYKIKYK